MLHRPILRGRLDKQDYTLIEYDLAYESLKSIKGQVVANFIFEYQIDIEHNLDVNFVSITPWNFFFDGSACSNGQGVNTIIVSPNDARFEGSI